MAFDLAGAVPRSEIVDFFEQARTALNGYADLDLALGRADRGFAWAVEKIGEQAARYQEPFRLVVVGEFNAGKSALINALLGRENFVSEGVVPTTGSVTEIWWAAEESGEVFDSDGKPEYSGDLATAAKYADQRTAEGKRLMARGRGARIVVRTDAPLVRNLVLIDTPGLGASDRDDAVTYGALDLADAAILVVSALQPGGEDTLRLGEWLRTHGRRVLLAVTRLDVVADPSEAMSAATQLLADVTDGEPIAFNPPAIHADLAALEAAELGVDEGAINVARELLAEHGYTALIDRLQSDFAQGDAGLSRLHAATGSVVAVLRQVSESATRASAAIEPQLEAAHAEVDDLDKRLHGVLPARSDFLDAKIDEAVDVRIGEFIARLTEAMELFIDKIADGSLKGTLRALRTVTKSGRQRVDSQIRRDFEDLFPKNQLQITVEDLSRAISVLMRAEWGEAATELAPTVSGHRVNVEGLSRDIVEKIAAANGEVLTKALAFVALLFAPGGIILGTAIFVLRIIRLKPKGQGRQQDISLQKREARVRLRNLRADLRNQLGVQYRQANHEIRDLLRAELSKDRGATEQNYARLQDRLTQLGQAVGDLTRFEAAANGLAGQGPAWLAESQPTSRSCSQQ